MRLTFTSHLLTAMLVIALASAFAQEQPPSNDQTPADTPPSSAPQTTPQTPRGNDSPSAAPLQNQPDQAAPKPDEPAPPNQNAPAIQEQPPPYPEAQPPQQAAPEANNPTKPKPSAHRSAQNKKRKTRTTAQAKSAGRPKTTTPSSAEEPGKVVVRNGGAKDDVIHLSPGGSQEQNAHNRDNTDQLLATTDENLKHLAGRQLSPAEQSTLDQIHSYTRQAKAAANAGDLARAHTLAFKAHLLSDDLAKH